MHFKRNVRSQSTADELRVLIVEDCDDDAQLIALQLEQTGLRVIHQRVDNPADMRRALLEAEWHVVISDHAIPDFSSRAALAVLKATGREIPFIVYSGPMAEEVASRLLDEGARDCIDKGDVARLVPVIQRELKDRADAPERDSSILSRGSDYDRLTGLPSRDRFMRLAGAVLARSDPHRPAVVCFIDFARFVCVNQTFGYEAGDALLAAVGTRLAHYARAGIAARFGGDEFVVLQTGFSDQDAVQRFVEDLSAGLGAPYAVDAMELHIAASIGVSVYPDAGRTLSELMINAETALYQCKRLMSRNAYLYYFPELNPVPGDQTLLESALWNALRREELRVYYQPCIAVASGRVTLVEALLRWQHPDLGLIGPDRFISLADECGLVGELDAWVLREACRQLHLWRSAGHSELSIAVNVSATEFAHPRLLGRTAMALRESGIPADALELEITEQALSHDTAMTLSTLTSLRKMGVRIAIDDFGTGNSSLASFKRFPIDVLKIDRTFVANVPHSRDDAAIARTIIGLGHNLDLIVHAEGVETHAQLDFLRAHGCERAQGYLFGRPVAAADVLALVRHLDSTAGRFTGSTAIPL